MNKLVAPAEDVGLVPSARTVAHNRRSLTPVPEDLMGFFWPPQATGK